MAKKAKRRVKRKTWTKAQLAELRKYSKDKLPVKRISRLMKRTGVRCVKKLACSGFGLDIVAKSNLF
jgi:hypothetical protein